MNISQTETNFEVISEDFLMGPQGRTELAKADVALLFGNPFIIDQLAETAAEYFHQGYFDQIIASGCGNWPHEYSALSRLQEGDCVEILQKTEAERMAESLEDYGVPSSAILLEESATNTQQNVENSRTLLERSGIEVSTCIAFGHIKAGTRFLETCARRWPEVFTMSVGVSPYDVGVDEWFLDEDFARHVLIQYTKLEKYRDQGDIVPVDLEAINEIARRLPQPGQNSLEDDCTFIM